MANDLIPGQQVFITYIHDRKPPFKAIISNVGNIYFMVSGLNSKFRISDLEEKEGKIGWPQNYKIWLSQNDFECSELLKRQKQLLIEKIPLLNQDTIAKILEIIDLKTL